MNHIRATFLDLAGDVLYADMLRGRDDRPHLLSDARSKAEHALCRHLNGRDDLSTPDLAIGEFLSLIQRLEAAAGVNLTQYLRD